MQITINTINEIESPLITSRILLGFNYVQNHRHSKWATTFKLDFFEQHNEILRIKLFCRETVVWSDKFSSIHYSLHFALIELKYFSHSFMYYINISMHRPLTHFFSSWFTFHDTYRFRFHIVQTTCTQCDIFSLVWPFHLEFNIESKK